MEKLREVVADKLGSENTVVKSILAEFIGTFFLLVSFVSILFEACCFSLSDSRMLFLI